MPCTHTLKFIKENTFLGERQKAVWLESLIIKKSCIVRDSGEHLPRDIR